MKDWVADYATVAQNVDELHRQVTGLIGRPEFTVPPDFDRIVSAWRAFHFRWRSFQAELRRAAAFRDPVFGSAHHGRVNAFFASSQPWQAALASYVTVSVQWADYLAARGI